MQNTMRRTVAILSFFGNFHSQKILESYCALLFMPNLLKLRVIFRGVCSRLLGRLYTIECAVLAMRKQPDVLLIAVLVVIIGIVSTGFGNEPEQPSMALQQAGTLVR